MTVLVTGGAASGKSEFAERELVRLSQAGGRRFYIATMPSFGDENRARIERHKLARLGRGFETIERSTALTELTLPECGQYALLEDIGNLAANEIFSAGEYGTMDFSKVCDRAAERMVQGVLHVASQCEALVVVTNDVSRDGGQYDAETTGYIRTIERVNRALAAEFDTVYEVVVGIKCCLK